MQSIRVLWCNVIVPRMPSLSRLSSLQLESGQVVQQGYGISAGMQRSAQVANKHQTRTAEYSQAFVSFLRFVAEFIGGDLRCAKVTLAPPALRAFLESVWPQLPMSGVAE